MVDWYLGEKLAFDVIAASQRPFVLVVGEPEGGRLPLLACNDTMRDVTGTFSVTRVDEDARMLSGRYESPANETVEIGTFELPAEPSMLVAEWQDDDGTARNHYLTGVPPFDLKTVRSWYEGVLHRTV